eukprot:TRINITY_DN916_c0_g1_i1.p1 TRINITY_DN916_c0_g1~~TRINITY_DN916_c0_g1_i1.p1  ORF type:complete len:203 (-),score=54.11 TRINITY_DN916_c0_g1_i1:258-866(-)
MSNSDIEPPVDSSEDEYDSNMFEQTNTPGNELENDIESDTGIDDKDNKEVDKNKTEEEPKKLSIDYQKGKLLEFSLAGALAWFFFGIIFLILAFLCFVLAIICAFLYFLIITILLYWIFFLLSIFFLALFIICMILAIIFVVIAICKLLFFPDDDNESGKSESVTVGSQDNNVNNYNDGNNAQQEKKGNSASESDEDDVFDV